MQKPKIFITGGTGYIGRSVINKLLENDFEVTALIRNTSKKKLPEKCKTVTGDALDSKTYQYNIENCDTFIHLVGVSHPGPLKSREFRSIDLVSIEQAVKVAEYSGIKNFIYLSVSNPAPIMKEYIKVRLKGEDLLTASGMNCSFIRPWYVIGPGHYWPLIFQPGYKLMEHFSFTKDFANRLGLVKLDQITECIYYAVNNPPDKIKIYNVQDIRKF